MNKSGICNGLFVVVSVTLTTSFCWAAPPTADFYVATNGSDDWSGTVSEPNAERSDGPFANLERARDAVRKLVKRPSKNVLVLIRGGTYRLKETVVFDLQDSRQGDSTVTYAAYPGETPVFSSGRVVNEWKRVTAELPGLQKVAIGNVYCADVTDHFLTLYDSEGLLPRARSKGFIPLDGGSRNELHFTSGRLKNWANVKEVEIVVRPHHAWIVNILPLASVDENRQNLLRKLIVGAQSKVGQGDNDISTLSSKLLDVALGHLRRLLETQLGDILRCTRRRRFGIRESDDADLRSRQVLEQVWLRKQFAVAAAKVRRQHRELR